MNPLASLWLICMLFESVEMGQPFFCFHCHQTSEECNEGDKLSLDLTNCSTNKCFVLKYETQMPGVNVLATFRGCLQESEHEIMRNVITQHHTVTEKHFHSCNSTLCNGAENTKSFHMVQVILALISITMLVF